PRLYTLSLHDALPISIVQVEVRLEHRVVDRPIVGHAVEALHPKVRGPEPREVRAPVDRAPADRVVHERRDHGGLVVDRIVLRERSEEHTSELQSLAYL